MPSKRQQLNVRLDDEGFRLLEEVRQRMCASLGLDLSQSDVVRAGIAELARRYPATGEADQKRQTRRRKVQ